MEKYYLVNLSVLNIVVYFSYSQSHVIEIFLFCVVIHKANERVLKVFLDLHKTIWLLPVWALILKNTIKLLRHFGISMNE